MFRGRNSSVFISVPLVRIDSGRIPSNPPPSVGTGHGSVAPLQRSVPAACYRLFFSHKRSSEAWLSSECSKYSEYLIDLLYSAESSTPHRPRAPLSAAAVCRSQTPPPPTTGEMSHQVICLFGEVDFYHLCFDSFAPPAPGTSRSSQYFH